MHTYWGENIKSLDTPWHYLSADLFLDFLLIQVCASHVFWSQWCADFLDGCALNTATVSNFKQYLTTEFRRNMYIRLSNVLWEAALAHHYYWLVNRWFFFLLNNIALTQACMLRTLCDPMDCSPPGSSVHGNSTGKNTRVSCKVMSLLFNTLSRFVIAFLPRSFSSSSFTRRVLISKLTFWKSGWCQAVFSAMASA